MAKVSKFIKSIFSDVISLEEQMVRYSWLDHLASEEKSARLAAQRLLDYYHRNTVLIREHVKVAAAKTFAPEESIQWQLPILNGVPRIVKRVSMTYKVAPERVLVRGDKELDPKAPEYDKMKEMYKYIDQDKKMKQADNYSTLLNCMHIEVVPRRDAIDWDFRLRPSVTVVPDPEDYLSFLKFSYKWEPFHPDTLQSKEGYVYWDDEWHIFVVANGDEYGLSLDSGANPYDGEIPIVTVRKIEQEDYWGVYGADLVDGFEQVNLQLANSWENIFLQAHGQPIATNLGIKTPGALKIGPRHPFVIEDLTVDDVPPSLQFAMPESRISDVRDEIDWFIKSLANAYGMAPGSWSLEETPESGFAKFMNNLELLENREDDIPQWQRIEQELFRKSVMVYNRWAKEQEHEKFPEDLELKVTFPPVSFPESPTEEASRWIVLIAGGLKNAADYYMETEGLTEEEAVTKAKKVKKQAAEIAQADPFFLPPAEDPNNPAFTDDDGDKDKGKDDDKDEK